MGPEGAPGEAEMDMAPPDPMADEEGDELAPDDAEMDMGAEEGPGGMVSMEDFMAALEQAIEEVTGEEAAVSEEPGGEEGEEEEVGMEMGPEGGEEMEMGEEEIMAEILRRLRETKKGEKKKTSGKKRGSKKGDEAYVNELESPSAHAARSSGRRTPKKFRRGEDEGEFGAEGPILTGDDSEMLSATDPKDDPEPEEREYSTRRHSRRRRPQGGLGIPGVTSEQLVNTVAKRVAARLKAEGRKAQMVDTLAERIMHRLTK
jgi:hypothetical protein